MNETNANIAEESKTTPTPNLEDAIKKKLEETGKQNMLIGAQAMCKVIIEKIYVAKNKPGKFSYRDYERLVNDIEDFCVTGLSRDIESDETATVV